MQFQVHARKASTACPSKAIEALIQHAPYLSRITDWSHVVVAGGSVARALFPGGFALRRKMPDTDLFLHGIRDACHLQRIVRQVCADLQHSWMLRSKGLIHCWALT